MNIPTDYSPVRDDEEEDIPSDFFDDFLSNDFMDGLDVVDTWDDEMDHQGEKASERPVRSTSGTKKRNHSRSRSPIRPRSREHLRGRSPRTARFRTRRSRERVYSDRQKRRSSPLRNRSQEESNPDHRRDPEKTRRDIQKDKDKCTKNQEDKIISEKLKVVETGLVPPGTEMDADIEALKPKHAGESKEKKNSRKKTPDKYVSPKRERNNDHRRHYKRSRSPYRNRSRSRSLKFSRRTSAERKRYVDKRGTRASPREYGPIKSGNKDFHRKSPSLDREKWKRPQEHHAAVNFFDGQQHLNPRREFVEEFVPDNKYYIPMQDRMNEPLQHYINPPAPVPLPVPAPVPIPDQYFPQIPMNTEQNYDQNFFIGQQFCEPYPVCMPYQPTPFIDCVPNSNVVTVPIVESNKPLITTIPVKNLDTPVNDIEKEKETINKMFEDKQISLSDFLSVSAKHADSSKPINVQKKIKVISLCQDAIKSLTGRSQLNGRFFLQKVQKEVDKHQDTKFQSPLRKTPFVRFSFTTAIKTGEQHSTLQNSLNKLLASLGLLEDSLPIYVKAVEEVPPPVQQPPAPIQASPIKRQVSNVKGGDSVFEIAPTKAKMCQTDFVKCQICEIRKSRTFVDKEVQCDVNYSTFATQVTEDDFTRPGIKPIYRDTLKNQSIAHLTPAQLMRQTLNQNEPKQQTTNFVPPRGISEVPPENSNSYRADNTATDFSRVGKALSNFNISLFETRPKNIYDMRPSFGNNRPNLFENRNNNPGNINNASIRGNAPMRASDFFDGGRQNYGNNPVPQHPMQQSNKRTLLPNPNFTRNF